MSRFRKILLNTLTNCNSLIVKTISVGATITSVQIPNGQQIALGFRNLEDYRVNPPYFGCAVGRYANRISNARFSINSEEFKVAANAAPNHLHGGVKGFNKYDWTVESKTNTSITYKMISPDGDEGYPGTLTVLATYTINDSNELTIEYTATTGDKPTIVNIANPTYFNLAGNGQPILDHVLELNADNYTPVGDGFIPTGEIASVADTVMDFRTPQPIGARYQQVPGSTIGYDHNYCINTGQSEKESLNFVGRLTDPSTNNSLSVFTNQPCVQLYMGGYLSEVDRVMVGLNGQPFSNYVGVCLETQVHPDAINQVNFPDPILNPGQKYYSKTVWKFNG